MEWVQGSRLSQEGRSLVAQMAENGGSVSYVPVMAPAARELHLAVLVVYKAGSLKLTTCGFKSYRKALAAGLVKPHKKGVTAMRAVLGVYLMTDCEKCGGAGEVDGGLGVGILWPCECQAAKPEPVCPKCDGSGVGCLDKRHRAS